MLRLSAALLVWARRSLHCWHLAIDELCMHVIRASCPGDLRPRHDAPCSGGPRGAPSWHPLPADLPRSVTIVHRSMAEPGEVAAEGTTFTSCTTALAARSARHQHAEAADSMQTRHDSNCSGSSGTSRAASRQQRRQRRRRTADSVAHMVCAAPPETKWRLSDQAGVAGVAVDMLADPAAHAANVPTMIHGAKWRARRHDALQSTT